MATPPYVRAPDLVAARSQVGSSIGTAISQASQQFGRALTEAPATQTRQQILQLELDKQQKLMDKAETDERAFKQLKEQTLLSFLGDEGYGALTKKVVPEDSQYKDEYVGKYMPYEQTVALAQRIKNAGSMKELSQIMNNISRVMQVQATTKQKYGDAVSIPDFNPEMASMSATYADDYTGQVNTATDTYLRQGMRGALKNYMASDPNPTPEGAMQHITGTEFAETVENKAFRDMIKDMFTTELESATAKKRETEATTPPPEKPSLRGKTFSELDKRISADTKGIINAYRLSANALDDMAAFIASDEFERLGAEQQETLRQQLKGLSELKMNKEILVAAEELGMTGVKELVAAEKVRKQLMGETKHLKVYPIAKKIGKHLGIDFETANDPSLRVEGALFPGDIGPKPEEQVRLEEQRRTERPAATESTRRLQEEAALQQLQQIQKAIEADPNHPDKDKLQAIKDEIAKLQASTGD